MTAFQTVFTSFRLLTVQLLLPGKAGICCHQGGDGRPSSFLLMDYFKETNEEVFSKDVENLIKSVQNKLLEVKYLSSTGEGKC